ncbi:MAG: hypothetical protein JO297_06165 [Nitrososphaeraceae archaeon]|nr:hypothetical protein [Nitrososphaeraceae archaeon]
MQRDGTTIQQHVLNSKLKLLAIIAVLVIAILSVPVILPHIRSPSIIYHVFLHIVSVIFAIFLSAVSIISYRRTNSTRILFMTLGFFALAIIETLYLFHATANIEDVIIPVVDIEVSHVILLIMLTLFGIGVLKVNK